MPLEILVGWGDHRESPLDLVVAGYRAFSPAIPIPQATPCCRNASAPNQVAKTRCLVLQNPLQYHGERKKEKPK